MKNKIIALGVLLTSSLQTSYVSAQTTIWTDGGGDQTWSTPSNWSAGVPTSGSAVQIGTQPTGDEIGIDTGSTSVASFAFNNTLTSSVTISAFGADTLSVAGPITNNSGFLSSFSLVVFAAGSSTWSGPLTFGNVVTIATNQITLANAITFTGTALNFDITNASTYGRFLGGGTASVTGVTINIGGAYTGTNGDTFDFTSGSFSGATLGSLPTLGGGLSWNSSNFLTNGTLSVVPEPQTWLLLALGLTVIVVLRRRQRA